MIIEYSNTDDSSNGKISLAEQKSIASCLNTIVTSQRGSIPYMRDLGMEHVLPKDNSPMAFNQHESDMIEQIESYEDRVTVTAVSFEDKNRLKVVVEYGGN